MGRCDPGDQILLKNSKCSESLQIERESRPRRYEPNAARLGSNRHREREISCSIQNDKQGKKGMLTVQSVQSVRMRMHGRTVRQVAELSGGQLAVRWTNSLLTRDIFYPMVWCHVAPCYWLLV
jgi:hypothetical protein